MKNLFFIGITNIRELKKEYIRLIKKYHPDNTPSDELKESRLKITQEINSEYEKILEILKKQNETADCSKEEQQQNYYYWKFNEEFKSVINVLAGCKFVESIELCGCFVWISTLAEKGTLNRLKELLPNYTIKYASKKKRFFICLNPDYHKKSFQELDMNRIREMYGSQKFSGETKEEKKKLALESL